MHNLSSSNHPEMDAVFLAGTAEEDITPPMGTILYESASVFALAITEMTGKRNEANAKK